MEFKDRLSKLRKELGLTQEDLAKKIGYTRTAISAWEIGRNEPSYSDIVKIADFFNVSTDYLLGKSNTPNPENETKLEDIYMHLAKEAQELKLDKDDVDFILNFYKKHKK